MSAAPIPQVKRCIHAHLRAIRSIRDVARYLRVSAETLRKDFRRSTGVTLSSYIVGARIARLKRGLARSRRRCFELAFDAGFTREDTAARTFRRRTGMTMGQYRRRASRAARRRRKPGKANRI